MAAFRCERRRAEILMGVALRVGSFCILVGLLAGIYWIVVRPMQLHWGATAAEIGSALPEDSIVAHPAFDATRAITIRGRPEEIWPWLVQMGYGRAGFYGYDLIENPGSGGGLRSATSILPQFQHPHPGDTLPLSVAASLQFDVVDPNRTLVWRGRENPPGGVFIWALAPVDATHTRLISRIRWRYVGDPVGRALGLFTEFADHVAVRAILRGVRDRVEGRRPASLAIEGAEIAGWLLAFAELGFGLVLVVIARRWLAAWVVALGAGLLLMLVLYGPAPTVVNAVLPWMYIYAFVRLRAQSIGALSAELGE